MPAPIMTARQRICMGGLGALTPIIVNLMVVDGSMLENLTMFILLGYVIRTAALFYAGGLTTYFHKTETNRVKLFQLGIGAPALLAMMINGANVDINNLNLAAPVNAAGEITIKVKDFQRWHETASQQFFTGVFGRSEDRNWYVIIGEFENEEFAVAYAKDIRKSNMFYAEVYNPYLNLNGYSVVIGEHLGLPEAKKLFEEAEEFGYHPRLWKYREGSSSK